MDILRKTSLLIFLFAAIQAFSQDDKIQELFRQTYALESDGKYNEAANLLKTIYNEDSYEINLRLGWLTYLTGNFTGSLPYYRKCIDLYPLSIEARLGIVLPLSSVGNWTEVELHYLRILEIDSGNSLVNYRMGLINYNRGDYQAALKFFEVVVNHYPFDYDSVIMLAWTHFKLGKYREAKVLFNKSLLIQPGDESALEGLGLIK